MARKGWGQLSPSYRDRLLRSGVGKSAYESGASLSAARGHGTTPEKPLRDLENVPVQYQSYAALRREIIQLKDALFGRKPNQSAESWLNSRIAEMKGKSQATLTKARDALETMWTNQISWSDFRDDNPEFDDEDWDWVGFYH